VTAVALLAGDTLRARAYLGALLDADLAPSRVLLLPPDGPTGAVASATRFDASRPVERMAADGGVPVEHLLSPDVNDPSVIEAVGATPEDLLVYAGFAGVLLGAELLGTGKSFLHVHPGWLPDFRGSTTVYYSLLRDGELAASALLLTAGVDQGPVLGRRRYPLPDDLQTLDGEYDAWVRADLLVRVLREHADSGRFEEERQSPGDGTTYYVIHPVLKHIALLREGAPPSP
jgi:methionyl-tRNA formyltransferase